MLSFFTKGQFCFFVHTNFPRLFSAGKKPLHLSPPAITDSALTRSSTTSLIPINIKRPFDPPNTHPQELGVTKFYPWVKGFSEFYFFPTSVQYGLFWPLNPCTCTGFHLVSQLYAGFQFNLRSCVQGFSSTLSVPGPGTDDVGKGEEGEEQPNPAHLQGLKQNNVSSANHAAWLQQPLSTVGELHVYSLYVCNVAKCSQSWPPFYHILGYEPGTYKI